MDYVKTLENIINQMQAENIKSEEMIQTEMQRIENRKNRIQELVVAQKVWIEMKMGEVADFNASPAVNEFKVELKNDSPKKKATDELMNFLKRENRVLSSTDFVKKYAVAHNAKELDVREKVYSAINSLKLSGKIRQVKKEPEVKMRGFYYALPKWLDKEDKLLGNEHSSTVTSYDKITYSNQIPYDVPKTT